MDADHRTEACELEDLARGRTAHVQRCRRCGSLSVHMGAVTLRFAPEALESVWNTLGEALIELHEGARAELGLGFEGRPVGRA